MKTTLLLHRFLLIFMFALIAPLIAADTSGRAAGDTSFTFKRGVNISHWLSQNFGERTYAASWFGESDIAWIAQQGFDHVRLPVDVRVCLGADGKLDPAKLKPIEDTISWSRSRGLGVVLDAHFLPGADFNPVSGDRRVYTDSALQENVANVWRQLASHFAGEGPWLRLEILNEPVAAENKQLNPFMHRMLAAIRESNPTRIVYVTSNKWSSFSTVPDVELPNDPNIALTIHNYEPLVFTHQRASWVGFKETLPAVTFPGRVPELAGHTSEHYNLGLHPGDELTVRQVQKRFEDVADWVAKHRPGLEIYVGEFGVYHAADPVSVRRWISTIVSESEKRGWGWAVWDYKGGFAVRAPDGSGTPVLEALFGKSK
jgi:endoglucanase